ncbi:MAG TPA: DMT family transporter [Thermomicrobiales bacterium]|jgi:drug/metabolite transporter (DMT)-like permease|nr:DMT family transporter [Thermomicrobiales bacterium]
MRAIDIAGLLVLGALWGGSFLFMRIASPALNALPVADVRVILGGGLLLLVAARRGVPMRLRERWRPYLLLGTIGTAVPFALISAAAIHLPASVASVLIATTPIFAALVGWVWLREPLSPRQLIGTVTGFAGVIMLVGWTPLTIDVGVVLSILAVAGAALCYGFTTHYSARLLRRTPGGMAIPVMQQLVAGAVLLPFALVTLPTEPPTLPPVLSLVALGLFSTGLAYLLFFRLMGRIGAFRANIATYLTPAFGVLWGALLLGEPLAVGTFVGFAVVLISALLMGGVRLSPARRSVSGGVEREPAG